ncbi:lactadherin-like [Clavelina lepadiformis]|uniref:F5/8 type C domain-containing protein n=1 Tax=Clavelina lepadiformis TaxID=159417 RepID=A0ABP0FN44_CLALP
MAASVLGLSVISVVLLSYFNNISGQPANEVCLSLSTGSVRQSGQASLNQGPPGRRGPQGPAGVCNFDGEEFNKFTKKLDNLEENVNRIMTMIKQADKVKYCSVGVRDGRVRDEDITASSIYDSRHLAKYGRLDNIQRQGQAGAWVPRNLHTAGEWIQVDLRTPTFVTGVVTQGRSNYDCDCWVTSFKIAYGNSTDHLRSMQQNGLDLRFAANNDNNSHRTNMFPAAIVARYIRIVAQQWNSQIAIRFDYLTC